MNENVRRRYSVGINAYTLSEMRFRTAVVRCGLPGTRYQVPYTIQAAMVMV